MFLNFWVVLLRKFKYYILGYFESSFFIAWKLLEWNRGRQYLFDSMYIETITKNTFWTNLGTATMCRALCGASQGAVLGEQAWACGRVSEWVRSECEETKAHCWGECRQYHCLPGDHISTSLYYSCTILLHSFIPLRWAATAATAASPLPACPAIGVSCRASHWRKAKRSSPIIWNSAPIDTIASSIC